MNLRIGRFIGFPAHCGGRENSMFDALKLDVEYFRLPTIIDQPRKGFKRREAERGGGCSTVGALHFDKKGIIDPVGWNKEEVSRRRLIMILQPGDLRADAL